MRNLLVKLKGIGFVIFLLITLSGLSDIDLVYGGYIWTGTHSNSKDYCSSSTAPKDVYEVKASVYSDQLDSTQFNYKYQYIKGSSATPTIIFLPGGPGGTSMGNWGQFVDLFLALPKDGNYILTDPRGNGCNKYSAETIPDDALSSLNIASDILTLIRNEKLDNYILYGHSYGTVVATIVAARAQAGEAVAPKALVLSGILGQAWDSCTMNSFSEYSLQWRKFMTDLPDSISNKLSSSALPLDLLDREWGAYISSGLIQGTGFLFGHEHNPFRDSLLTLNSTDPAVLEKLRKSVQSAAIEQPSPEMQRIFRQIACTEISDDLYENAVLQRGDLAAGGNDICNGLKLRDPYDAKNWPLSIPIYYFEGENDPAVPLWQARYHFDSQVAARRHFVTIPRAGHAPFIGNLLDCKDIIWKSIQNNGTNFESALKSCGWPTEIEVGHLH